MASFSPSLILRTPFFAHHVAFFDGSGLTSVWCRVKGIRIGFIEGGPRTGSVVVVVSSVVVVVGVSGSSNTIAHCADLVVDAISAGF